MDGTVVAASRRHFVAPVGLERIHLILLVGASFPYSVFVVALF
jgi:hypothetical protein